jgi:hypothetical protein
MPRNAFRLRSSQHFVENMKRGGITVTNDEKRLGQALVGLYRLVRLQQEALSRLMVGSEALVGTLASASSSFRDEFDRNYERVSASPTGRAHEQSFQSIDATIASLQRDFGPWDN